MENPYESRELLTQYLVFHYAGDEEQFPYAFGAKDGLSFPARCVEEGLNYSSLPGTQRALDIGCAVGRSTFELSRTFGEVIGIDYSHSFIGAAGQLQSGRILQAKFSKEGASSRRLQIRLPQATDPSKVHFEQGDAQSLRKDLGQFDAVLACNLICRLPDPRKLIARLPSLIKPGGQLFLTTPFTWLEEYTPNENWLGGEGQSSFDALSATLAPDFSLDAKFDMPFLIPETARKFQYTVALASRWVRRG